MKNSCDSQKIPLTWFYEAVDHHCSRFVRIKHVCCCPLDRFKKFQSVNKITHSKMCFYYYYYNYHLDDTCILCRQAYIRVRESTFWLPNAES